MKSRTKLALITTAGAVVAGLFAAEAPLGQLIWPAAPMSVEPSGGQVLGFMAFTFVSAIVFGLGLSFLVMGYVPVRRVTMSRRDAVLAYAAIAWILLSWFPHDNLHMALGDQPGGILALLWGFHVTLMIAGLALAWVVLRTARVRSIQHLSQTSRTGGSKAPRPAATDAR